jgi:uncharacterized protein YjbI with pentapeptide repeats
LQEAELYKANLQGADLSEADMQGAVLIEANLQDAFSYEANLQNANLERANLQKAELLGANLQNANLSKADMPNTTLDGVKGLAEANLQYANMEGATGLLGNEFAQADLTGTKLPKNIEEFKALETVKETSQNARKIFFAMLLGFVYSWLTIATTTDVRLEEATLQQANLFMADLTDSILEKADLTGAKNLTIEQLSKVKTLYGAKLDPELMEQVKKSCPHLLEKPTDETDQKDETK